MNEVRFLKNQYYLFTFLLVISFLGDILNRYSIHSNFEFIRYSTVSKIVFIIVSIGFLSLNFKQISITEEKKKILLLSTLLVSIYFIGRLNNPTLLKNNIFYLSKYLFFPFILFLFFDLRESKKYILKLFCVFEIIFFTNIIAMVLGFIFDISVFETYYLHEHRFGYKGIFSMSGQTSVYFILMMFYYIHQLVFKGHNKLIFIKLSIVILCSLLIGTKRIFFFLPILILYYLFFLNGFRKKITYKSLGIIVLTVVIFWESLIKYLSNLTEYFYAIYQKFGFLSFFTSYRNNLLQKILDERFNSLNNYLFGGLDFNLGWSQMGIIDLILFFGLLGMLVYLSLYKILINFSIKHHFYYFFLISLLVIVFLADAFILDTNVPVLFFLLSSYFYIHETRLHTNK